MGHQNLCVRDENIRGDDRSTGLLYLYNFVKGRKFIWANDLSFAFPSVASFLFFFLSLALSLAILAYCCEDFSLPLTSRHAVWRYASFHCSETRGGKEPLVIPHWKRSHVRCAVDWDYLRAAPHSSLQRGRSRACLSHNVSHLYFCEQ